MRKCTALFVSLSAFLIVGTQPARAQAADTSPTVRYPADTAISPRLSDLPPGKLDASQHAPIQHPYHPIPRGTGASTSNASDHALQNWAAHASLARHAPAFSGITATGYIPPDPNIAVGPNHIVQVVNSSIAVFDKTGKMFSGYPKTLSSVWTGLAGGCSTNNAGDPVAQYDRLADRWIITQLGSLKSPYSQCIAVSTSGDPTGTYYLYAYNFGTTLNDYSKFGVWPTATNGAYLATANLFANGQTFVGADLCAWDRAAMLAGQAAGQVCFTISNDGGYLPSDLDGATGPADGTPGYFMTWETTSSLRVYTLSFNAASPSSSTLSSPSDISVASFTMPCNNTGGTCIPQSGTTQTLDSLGDRLMYRLAYRVFSDHESFVVNHSVTAGSAVGVRWYELRKPVGTSGAVTLYQQGTYAPSDGLYRWMGSVAMDLNGNIAVGYSASSSSAFPSIRVATRAATDALGTLTGETTLQAGGGSQTGYTRWGDYTSMRLDPTDDCTFWYTNEYYSSTSSASWKTYIGSLQMPGCANTTPQTLTVTVTGSGTGSVSSNPAGISCPGTCSASFPGGTTVTLTAAATSGSGFAGWSGACTGTSTTCNVTMSQAQAVTATFNTTPTSYSLSVSKTGTGTGTVTSNPAGINCGTTCTASFASGTSVTLTAAASAGSTFAGWSGPCSGTGACTVTMTQAQNVTATFNASTTNYTLTVTRSGAGSVTSSPSGINCGSTCSATYGSGTSVTLTATPRYRHTFVGWSGACSGSALQCTLTMNGNKAVNATFH